MSKKYKHLLSPIKIGNIHKNSVEEIMNHEFLWKFRKRSENRLLKGKCVGCEFANDKTKRAMCSGGASCISYGYYGDPFMADPQCSIDLAPSEPQNAEGFIALNI